MVATSLQLQYIKEAPHGSLQTCTLQSHNMSLIIIVLYYALLLNIVIMHCDEVYVTGYDIQTKVIFTFSMSFSLMIHFNDLHSNNIKNVPDIDVHLII